jgi:hypothetical protein
MTKRRFGKITGIISTLFIFLLGIMPNTFNIPMPLRPWVLLGSIAWIVVFSSGVISS